MNNIRFDAEIYKGIGGAPEHVDSLQTLERSGVRYTVHHVAARNEPIWLGFGGEIDLGSVRFADRQACSRSAVEACLTGDSLRLRQGAYRAGTIVLQAPGLTESESTGLIRWTGPRDDHTGRPVPEAFSGQPGIYIDGQGVLISLPDIIASVMLRWSLTDEPTTPTCRPPVGVPTAFPRLDEVRRDLKVKLYNPTIQFMIVEQVMERHGIVDRSGASTAHVLTQLEADGFVMRQQRSQPWTPSSVIKKRSEVKTTLGKLGYRSGTTFALENRLPFGTLDGLALAAERYVADVVVRT